MTRRGATLFVLMSVVWGVPYLLIKVAVTHMAPSVVVEGRTLVGALVLLPLAWREGQLGQVARAWRPLLAYTVAELAIPWWLLSNAERRLPSSLSGLLVATVPLISVVVVTATGRRGSSAWERMDRRGVAGLCVGLVGVAVVLGLDVTARDLGSVGMVLLVAVGYATGPLIASRYMDHLSSLALSAVSLALVAVVYLPVAIWQRPRTWPPATALVSVVTLGLVCTALAFVAFFELIREVSPTRATVITYFNPIVAVLLGVLLLGEAFRWATGLGFILILGGSWLSRPRRAGARGPRRRSAQTLAIEP